MNENLKKIKVLCDQIYYTGNTSEEHLFTVNCVDYFYYNKNITADDIDAGFVDGANDGGIDFIYYDDEKIYFVQGKTSKKISYNEIRDIFYKMRETYISLINDKLQTYSQNLKTKFLNIYDSFPTDPDMEFVLFSGSDFNSEIVRKIEQIANSDDFNRYTLSAYSSVDIQDKVLSVDQNIMLVNYGTLDLDHPRNFLSYNDDQGAIFTIKAHSLKKLFIQFHSSGLFGYNLREHIRDNKVDTAIDKTIKNEPSNFWYLNNGITIACSDFKADGNNLKLWDFSIINGAQTTTKIGKSTNIDANRDFSLVCKVVKSKGSLNDDFIRNISQASNSQKPIKQRDLKANSNIISHGNRQWKNCYHGRIDIILIYKGI